MSLSTAQINAKIAQAQRAQASYMLDAVRKEKHGNVPTYLYLKTRYISAAIRVLTNTNHGLTNLEIEKIIHCMLECGDIADFDTSPLVFPAITVIVPVGGGVRITDLLDGPMGSLTGYPLYLLRVNAAGTAWEWIPPTGIVASIQIANTVFVAKNGVDATGVIGQLDKPFLTLAAARVAAVAATPSITNRIKIVVFSGTYLEGIVLANYVDWELNNIVLDLQAGALATIDDNSVACNSIITGNAIIKRTTAGTLGCIRTVHASSVLLVNCFSLASSIGETILCTNGTQNIVVQGITNSNALSEVVCTAGTQKVTCADNIGNQTTTHSVKCNGGTQVIKATTITYGVACTAGTQTITANISQKGITCSAGYQVLYGNVQSTVGSVAVSNGSGEQYIYGSLYQLAAGAVAYYVCENSGGISQQYIYANPVVTGLGAGIVQQSSTAPAIYVNTTAFYCTYESNFISSSAPGLYVGAAFSGTCSLSNSKISVAPGQAAIYKGAGTLIIKNCTLVAGAGSYCISSPSAQSVKVYGHCDANLGTDPAFLVTQLVNSITVDSNVV